jgi:hypothetical protein
MAMCVAVSLLAGAAFAAEPNGPSAVSNDSGGPSELLPVDVILFPERSEIRKIYELSPDVDPSRLPRGNFERDGLAYKCTDILREVVIGEESKTVTVTETAESKKNDTNTVLGLFPQYRDYTDEDGFAGTLLLNTATIKSEVSGYGSSGTPYSVTRNYPNLSDTDTQYIPKTLDDNGKTLQMQDVQWQTDNTYNADDYEICDRYTAVVTYGGTKTSSYVKGYNIAADYTGEVTRKGVAMIRYTVIFAGTEIPEPKQDSEVAWPAILLSALALFGCGVCAYLTLRKRKETRYNEKVPDYDRPDAHAGDADGDSGIGGGDGERSERRKLRPSDFR